MPATAPEMTRRGAIFTLCAASAFAADAAQDVWEVVTKLAAALGSGDAGEFLSLCDSTMPGYAALRVNVSALIAQADAESGIDPVENAGSDGARQMVVDWQLHLVDRSGLQRVTRRRENVKVSLEKRGRRWKIVSLQPIVFFAPPAS
jgi:hypothetical protein